MKKNKIILAVFFVISVFLQIFYFRNSDKFYEYGFAIGIDNTIKYAEVGISLMYVLVPLIFIVFFMSGSIYNLANGYGKIMIVRNYSKTKLFLKNCLKNTTAAAIIVAVQLIAFLFFNYLFMPLKNGLVQSIIMYFLVLNLIIVLQCVLELFVSPHIANIAIFIYSFVSYYAAQIITENAIIKIILFPCLLFGMQNGATDASNEYYLYLTSAIVLNLLLITLGISKFKKTDIF